MHQKHEAGCVIRREPAPVAVMWCDAPENASTQRYVAIKNIAPGVRLRRPFTSRTGNDCDLNESDAHWLFNEFSNERIREIEATMRKAAEARDA